MAVAGSVVGGPWSAAQAHGGGPPARPVVIAVEPPTAGITATAVFLGTWRIELTSTSRQTVAVLDAADRPFLRFSPAGVEADYGAAAWHDAIVAAQQSTAVDSAPDWLPVSRIPTWSWFDTRIRPERGLLTPQILQSNRPVLLRNFEIPLRVGEQRGFITGYLEYEGRTGAYRHTIVTASRPVAGLEVGLVLGSTVPTLTLDNQTGQTVTILGRDGEPFARIGGESVDANLSSPTWVEFGQSLGVVPTVVSDASARPQWTRILEGHRWSWPDYRSRPPDAEPAAILARGGVVKRWAVPLEVGSRRLEIDGISEFVPFVPVTAATKPSSSPLPASMAAILGGLGLLLLLLTRRRRSSSTDCGAL
jgi:MYXO-CTERM domain-containing protein